MANNFCGNCGEPLKPGANFCRQCGTKVSGETKPPAEEPRKQVSYSYKLAIPANYKKGLVSMKGCTIVFSETDMIIAMSDRKLMNEHIASVREGARD